MNQQFLESIKVLCENMNMYRESLASILDSPSIENYDVERNSWIDTESTELCFNPDFYVNIQANAPPFNTLDLETEDEELLLMTILFIAAYLILTTVILLISNQHLVMANLIWLTDAITWFKSMNPFVVFLIQIGVFPFGSKVIKAVIKFFNNKNN